MNERNSSLMILIVTSPSPVLASLAIASSRTTISQKIFGRTLATLCFPWSIFSNFAPALPVIFHFSRTWVPRTSAARSSYSAVRLV
ncbi:hypothetical protein F5Y19DRAFT_412138 [Xylariaceae sp. FL1651]|nr:hypothetical protein F5Y19DRAFT_412138 [Xylariaceae sp. FL1651]